MKGINPRQIQGMMKQFGIKSEELDAERVVIELKDRKIIIENPNVSAVDMQGKKTYTVMGEEKIESSVSEDDVKLVMEQAQAGKEEAEKALKDAKGDIAEAIMKLKK
jgi:nascent polypeptide-associated complex subunit alpha